MLIDFLLGTYRFQQHVELGVCGKHIAHLNDLSKQLLHVTSTSPAGDSVHIWGLIVAIPNFHSLQCDQKQCELISAEDMPSKYN